MAPFCPFILLIAGAAQEPSRAAVEAGRALQAVRLAETVTVDGRLDESVWKRAPAAEGFSQREPQEGARATERTEVRFAYDDSALYVAARLHDQNPRGIVRRLGRRDAWLDADIFVVYVDGYKDGRSGAYFSVNAGGTLGDGTLFNDDWDDDTWDGVWEGRAAVDDAGWSVEMRLPFSELRFHDRAEQVWGVNCRRLIGRSKEDDYLVPRPKDQSGFVSRFLELRGIQGIRPPARLAVTPYVTARAESMDSDPGDPFNDGSSHGGSAGADAKLGLGSSLTLDLTLNPDFGQVEVDPGVVNLSDVETFYPEKRPFFIEGANLVDSFGFSGASNFFGFNWGNPSFFYSRRIGRAPQGELPDADYSSSPSGTTILGAAKLTGKAFGQWNVSTLHAFTQREYADVQTAGERSRAEVEPASYYGVFRTQRSFDDNRYGFGAISTYARRLFEDAALEDQINASAFSLGADGWAFLDRNKAWVLTGWAGVSDVRGTQERIADVQRSSLHYLQRPDADRVRFDAARTSLRGWAGRVSLNKERGSVLVNAALGAISPGFDVSDLGFQWRADVVNGHVWGSYRWTKPSRIARQANVDAAVFRSYDFDGNRTWDGVFTFAGLQFLNYYRLRGFAAYNPETVGTRLTRGGPRTLNPRGVEWELYAQSDERGPILLRFGWNGREYARRSENYRSVFGAFEWRPGSNVSVSLEPRYEWGGTSAQYVETIDDVLAAETFAQRYVFARLVQETFSAGIRLNWTFSPRVSLQLYAQPLVASGDYTDLGELARPLSYEFRRYTSVSLADAVFTVDPDAAGPAAPFSVDDPSFRFRSVRGNAVFRWEFRPGSTAYVVWTQTRSDAESAAHNIFLAKLAWRFSR